MEHYSVGEVRKLELDVFKDISLDGGAEALAYLTVRSNSRVSRLLEVAFKHIEKERCQHVVWIGDGDCADKVVKCSTIMKKEFKNLYLLKREGYQRTEEYWEPLPGSSSGLSRLKVNRDVKVTAIVLSKSDYLSQCATEPGYCGPGDLPSLGKSGEKKFNQKTHMQDKHRKSRKKQSKPKSVEK